MATTETIVEMCTAIRVRARHPADMHAYAAELVLTFERAAAEDMRKRCVEVCDESVVWWRKQESRDSSQLHFRHCKQTARGCGERIRALRIDGEA